MKKIFEKSLPVTLKDLYCGKQLNVSVTFDEPCDLCGGRGTKEECEPPKCTICQGRGLIMQQIKINPFMVQQNAIPCGTCLGSGHIIDDKIACDGCKGKKTKKSIDKVACEVKKGMFVGDHLIFDQNKYYKLIITLQESQDDKHVEIFERIGQDLRTTVEITLQEALFGVHRSIEHIDGRLIYFCTPPDIIIQWGSDFRLEGEGITLDGDLIICFDIRLTSEDRLMNFSSICVSNKENEKEERTLKLVNF